MATFIRGKRTASEVLQSTAGQQPTDREDNAARIKQLEEKIKELEAEREEHLRYIGIQDCKITSLTQASPNTFGFVSEVTRLGTATQQLLQAYSIAERNNKLLMGISKQLTSMEIMYDDMCRRVAGGGYIPTQATGVGPNFGGGNARMVRLDRGQADTHEQGDMGTDTCYYESRFNAYLTSTCPPTCDLRDGFSRSQVDSSYLVSPKIRDRKKPRNA